MIIVGLYHRIKDLLSQSENHQLQVKKWLYILATFALSLVILLTFQRIINVQAARLSHQTDSEVVALTTHLWVNVRDSSYPTLTFIAEITGTKSAEHLGKLDRLEPSSPELRIAAVELLDELYLLKPEQTIDESWKIQFMPDISSGLATISYTHKITVEKFSQVISLPYPFEVILYEDNLKININPELIPNWVDLKIYVHLLGAESLVNQRSSLVQYTSRTFLDWTPEGTAAWEFPPESDREPDTLEITLPSAYYSSLSLGELGLSSTQTVTITTSIAIGKANLATLDPSLTSTVTIEIPSNWPYLDGLITFERYKPEYQQSLKSLLNTLGYWSRNRVLRIPRIPPEIKITESVATLTFFGQLDSLPLNYLSNRIQDDVTQIAFSSEGSYLVLELDVDTMELPNYVNWVVDFDLPGLEIISAQPIPSNEYNQSHLKWIFNKENTGENIIVRTALPLALSLGIIQNQILEQGQWEHLVSAFNLVMNLIVVFWIFRVLPRYRDIPLSPLKSNIRDVRRILGWILAILIGVQLTDLLYRVFIMPHIEIDTIFTVSKYILSDLLFPIAALGFVVVALMESQSISIRFKISMSVLSLVLTVFIVWGLIQFQQAYFDPFSSKVLPIVYLPVQLILILLLTVLIIYGFIQIIARVLLDIDLLALVRQHLSRNIRNIITLFIVALFVILQWLVAMYYVFENWQGGFGIKEWSCLLGLNVQICGEVGDKVNTFIQMILNYPKVFVYQLDNLLPLILLAAIIGLLDKAKSDENSVILSSDKLWVLGLAYILFAGFVADRGILLLRFYLPLGFFLSWYLLPRLLTNKLAKAQDWIEKNNEHKDSKLPLMITSKLEFIQRAKAIKDLENKQSDLHQKYSKGETNLETYEGQRKRLHAEIQWLEKGVPGKELTQDSVKKLKILDWWEKIFHFKQKKEDTSNFKMELRQLVQLPENLSPKLLALSLGPGNHWLANGMEAVRIGRWITILPLSYYVYVLLRYRVRIILSSGSLGLINIIENLLSEIAFWLVAAFVMGILYPYLRGRHGAFKGIFLGSIYFLVVGVVTGVNFLLGSEIGIGWIFRPLQLLLFLIVLGVWLDLKTLNKHNIYWRQILDHYNLQDARVLLGYLSPLAALLYGIIQQILTGAASQSIISEILKGLTTFIPNIPPQ